MSELPGKKEVDDYVKKLGKAYETGQIVPNDNIMNTYCVLLWMLQNCKDIIIYCGEARLFTVNGKKKLQDILDKDAVKYLHMKVIDAFQQFVSVKNNSLRVICERRPVEWDKDMLQVLREPNVSISLLNTEKAPYFPYHFMVGDDTIYRRETNHSEKEGLVRFFTEICKIFRAVFSSYNKDYFVKRLDIA